MNVIGGVVVCAVLAVMPLSASATTVLFDAPPAAQTVVAQTAAAPALASATIETPDGQLTINTPWGAESRTSQLFDFRLPASVQQILSSGVLGQFANTTQLLDIAALPETSTWAMMIGGLGVIGYAIRRRARRSKPALN